MRRYQTEVDLTGIVEAEEEEKEEKWWLCGSWSTLDRIACICAIPITAAMALSGYLLYLVAIGRFKNC